MLVSKMKFEKINLKNKARPNKVTALVCQLRFDESDWDNEKDLFKLNNKSRIEDYLDHITYAISNFDAHLIVLPELSIPNYFLSQLQNISKQSGIIIVGGSHYHEENDRTISRCPVIINGIVYYTDKINPSPLEISPIKGNGLSNGETIKIFQNSLIGNFAVIICADYLDQKIRAKLASYNLDFVIIIAFQKDSEQYHERMNVDCEELDYGSYFLYSNVLCPPLADGRSGLFGIMDKIFSKKLVKSGWSNGDPETKLVELPSEERLSYFVVDIDVTNKKPSFLRNIHTKPNVSIVTKDESTREYEKIEDKRKRLKMMNDNIKKRRE
jgi:hypothetical protein